MSKTNLDMSPKKKALLNLLLQKSKRATIQEEASLSVRPPDISNAPLSHAQESFWILHQLSEYPSEFNITKVFQIEGLLNVKALEKSLNEIIKRHDALRSRCEVIDGQPMLHVLSKLELTLPIIDLSKIPKRERPETINQLVEQEEQFCFDLEKDILIRVKLVLKDNSEKQPEYILLFNFHHFVMDGYALRLFYQELNVLYNHFALSGLKSARTNQASFSLPLLSVQYSDFAYWQRQRNPQVYQKQFTYWQEKLKNIKSNNLPIDKARSADSKNSTATHQFIINKELSHGLKQFSQQEGITVFTTLMTVFYLLLNKYTQEKEIIITTAVTNRLQQETEQLIGSFANNILLNISIKQDWTFQELLGAVQEVIRQGFAHQELPFELLLKKLPPSYHVIPNPLLQTSFEFHEKSDQKTLRFEELNIEELAITKEYAYSDLGLLIRDYKEVLFAEFNYNADLFNADSIERFATHFLRLLGTTIENPRKKITSYNLLSFEEQQQLLYEFNDTQVDFPEEKNIVNLFEEQVVKTPNQVAIIFEDKQLTYQQINEQANRVGHYLKEIYSVQTDDIIALQLERSEWMIIAILGVLKSGAAYLPIDIEMPISRVQFMLEDSKAKVVLVDKDTDILFTKGEQKAVIEKIQNITYPIISNPSRLSNSQEVAYIIYTSGSTGRPKGVIGTHSAIINRFYWMWTKYPFQPNEVCCQKTSISFVDAIWEIFGPMLQGIPLVIIPKEILLSPQQFIETLATYQVSRLLLVPSLLNTLLTECSTLASKLPKLQYWTTSGEVLQLALYKRFKQALPNALLLNLYGSSEVAADVTYYDTEAVVDRILIGRPINNTQVFILDHQLQLVPIGVTGELYIGGAGLAKGYLNNLDLTAKKFIPHPFKSGARLYKTGDLTRWLPHGEIEFLGRADFQVKIRGYRIEVGEIEQILLQHPAIESVVVVARKSGTDDQELIAYIVFLPHETPDLQALKYFIKQHLPSYMVPAVFVTLDALPLNISGKINRKALPDFEQNRLVSPEEFVAPSTTLEVQLAEIWKTVLKIEGDISIYDDFFDLGGHSLLATQVISRINQQLNQQIPLQLIFKYPSITDLVISIEQLQTKQSPIAYLPIVTQQRPTHLPLSFAQQRLWFLDQFGMGAAYNISIQLHLSGTLDIPALQAALDHLIQRHESLRTCFKVMDSTPFQYILTSNQLPLQLMNLREEEVDSVVMQQLLHKEVTVPFDLSKDLMIRASLLLLPSNANGNKTTSDEQILLITLHHIASDGWSMGILTREITQLYEAFRLGQTPTLVPLSIQYADFSLWQKDYLKGAIFEEQLDYWKEQLQDLTPLRLPTDRSRPKEQDFKGAAMDFLLETTLTKGLKALSQRQGTTLYMTLLAAFQILLHRYTGQSDIVIGSPIANRHRKEVEELIGFFVNTLVMRLNLEQLSVPISDITFLQVLAQVKSSTQAAYEHQDMPFELLVEELQPERQINQNPLVQILFAFQNAPREQFHLTGLEVTQINAPTQHARSDMEWYAWEVGDQLQLRCVYSTVLFDKTTVQRMLQHFKIILESIVAQPTQRIATLPILPLKEQQQLLFEFNDTKAAFPQDKTIVNLFEEQVVKTPNKIAIIFEDKQLTYQQLNEQANQVGHYLRETYSIQINDIIALQLERSEWMIIAILGVLKSGAAYLPIDMEMPISRVQFMLEDSKAKVVLVDKDVHILSIKKEQKAVVEKIQNITYQTNSNPNKSPNSQEVAYIIYTSGSTGQPKGVIGTHSAIINRFYWMWTKYPFQANEVCCQKTSISFVDAIWEIFGPMLQGIPLVIIPKEILLSPQQFIQTLATHQVSRLLLVPSLLNTLLTECSTLASKLPDLHYWTTSGEVLPLALYKRFKQALPNALLLNLYGASEVAADVTYYDTEAVVDRILIGRPINNTQIFILDQQLQLVPIGVTGELYIGGAGLAKGYLNNLELTAKKFIPHPVKAGERLYKTGDLARWLSDGEIEFLGRVDFQVKIRGYRIELGEIEHALLAHPQIESAVVVAKNGVAGHQELVAYMVLNESEMVDYIALRRFLKERLPSYMLPAAFVVLDALPLTTSGKVNRKALPDPERNRQGSMETFVAPTTPTEIQLAEIWKTVLELKEDISIQDDFFDLGGHSLIAVQLLEQIRQATGHRLKLSSFFQFPTIAEQSKFFNLPNQSSNGGSLFAIQPKGTNIPLFLVPPARDMGWSYRKLARYLNADQPVYTFEPVGADGKRSPHTSVEEMATYYIKEMRNLQRDGPYRIGGMCFGGQVAWEMGRQLEQANIPIDIIFILDADPPVNSPNYTHPEERLTLRRMRKIPKHAKNGTLLGIVKRFLHKKYRAKKEVIFNEKIPLLTKLHKIQIKALLNYEARASFNPVFLIQSQEFADKLIYRGGWQLLSKGVFECTVIPDTTHRSLLIEDDKHIQKLADHINTKIMKLNILKVK